MNFTARTRRKYAIYFGKRFRLQQESPFKQILMPLWLSGFFFCTLDPKGLFIPGKAASPTFAFQSCLPFCTHQTWVGVESYTASHRCCLTPLTQLVPDVAHLFQTSSSMSNPISLTLGTHLLYPQRKSIFESLGKILQLLFFSSLFIFNLLLTPKSFTPLTSLLM